jgi:hypothetical protein
MLSKQELLAIDQVNSQIEHFHATPVDCLQNAEYLLRSTLNYLAQEELSEEDCLSVNTLVCLSISLIKKASILQQKKAGK